MNEAPHAATTFEAYPDALLESPKPDRNVH